VTLVAAGYKGGQPRQGVEKAPEILLRKNIVQEIKNLGWAVDPVIHIDQHFEGEDSEYKNSNKPVTAALKNPKKSW